MLSYKDMLALPPLETVGAYSERDTILYALGLGVGADDPTSRRALRYVYEEGLEALPTMAVVLASPGFYLKEPRYQVAWKKVLHGEQRLNLHRPLPVRGRIRSKLTFDEIYDKGPEKGALLYSTRKIFDDDSGELLATLGSTSFLRGDGGCGGATTPAPSPHKVPDGRSADLAIEIHTRIDQALLYRLSGDFNPLHVDPEVARSAAFERPILHGLCTYGIAGRVVLSALCANEPSRLKRLDVRFSRPVYPGASLKVEIWRDQPGRASLRVRDASSDAVVLDNGYVEFAGSANA